MSINHSVFYEGKSTDSVQKIHEDNVECNNGIGQQRYYRLKEGSTIDPIEYSIKHGTPPYDDLDEITEDQFLDGSGKTICYGVAFDKFKAIVKRREQELPAVPAQI